VVLLAFEASIGLVVEVITTAGDAVSFVVVRELVEVLPAASLAVTVYVIVPSASALVLMPSTDHVPLLVTVVVTAVVVLVPLLATTEILAPTSPVPLAVVFAAFAALIGLVTELIATDGGVVSSETVWKFLLLSPAKEFPPPELS